MQDRRVEFVKKLTKICLFCPLSRFQQVRPLTPSLPLLKKKSLLELWSEKIDEKVLQSKRLPYGTTVRFLKWQKMDENATQLKGSIYDRGVKLVMVSYI